MYNREKSQYFYACKEFQPEIKQMQILLTQEQKNYIFSVINLMWNLNRIVQYIFFLNL